MSQRPLRRAVIKEELVALTGDFMEALVLNQLLYWTRRVRDYNQLLQEEAKRAQQEKHADAASELQHGWIYKTAEELSQELMVGRSATTMRRIISRLVAQGWISERSNPHNAWDKTKQYRVNLATLQRELAELGYSLDGHELSTGTNGPTASQQPQTTGSEPQNITSKNQNTGSKTQNVASNLRPAGAIPEITAEIAAKNTAEIKNKEKQSQPPSDTGLMTASVDLLAKRPESRRKNGAAKAADYTPEFEAFWQAYPKKHNKWRAWRQWQAALKRQRPASITASELIAAAHNYAQSVSGTDPRFIMHPATFLGPDCRFLDYMAGSTVAAVPNGLSEQEAAELVEMINRTPEALRMPTLYHVWRRLQQNGFDLAYGDEAGTYALCLA